MYYRHELLDLIKKDDYFVWVWNMVSGIKSIIFRKVLTMEYNSRDYWDFGLCPSSNILKHTKEHNVSETGFVSVF
jgi:hypothetical protein